MYNRPTVFFNVDKQRTPEDTVYSKLHSHTTAFLMMFGVKTIFHYNLETSFVLMQEFHFSGVSSMY